MGGRVRWVSIVVIVVVVVAVASACHGSARFVAGTGSGVSQASPPGGWLSGGREGWRPTLLVHNRSGELVVQRAGGRRIATVTPGASCVHLPQLHGRILLEVRSVADRPGRTWEVNLDEATHWRAELRPGGVGSDGPWPSSGAARGCGR